MNLEGEVHRLAEQGRGLRVPTRARDAIDAKEDVALSHEADE